MSPLQGPPLLTDEGSLLFPGGRTVFPQGSRPPASLNEDLVRSREFDSQVASQVRRVKDAIPGVSTSKAWEVAVKTVPFAAPVSADEQADRVMSKAQTQNGGGTGLAALGGGAIAIVLVLGAALLLLLRGGGR